MTGERLMNLLRAGSAMKVEDYQEGRSGRPSQNSLQIVHSAVSERVRTDQRVDDPICRRSLQYGGEERGDESKLTADRYSNCIET